MKNYKITERTPEAIESYRATAKTYREAAQAVREAYRDHREGTPAETIAAAIAAVGYDMAAAVVATWTAAKAWDGRISRTAAEWAETVPDAVDDETRDRFRMGGDCDQIHPVHLDQLAREFARTPRPEDPAEEEEAQPAGVSYTINEERGGVEVSFPGKPSEAVRDQLKAAGFRWHNVRRVWYAKQTPDRLALVQSLAGSAAPVQVAQKTEPQKLTAEALEAITAKYSEMITADGEGIYAGYTGANGRGLYGQDLKKAILAELKKNGFSATARSGRGGYTDSFTFTVKVPEAFTISEADYIKTETEGRAAFRGVYWYTTPAGESIHRDALPYDYEERQPILEETARRAYRDSVANQSGENVAEVFKKAVRAIVTSFNSDHSDSMTDYFDRGIYDWYRWAAV